MNKTAIKNFAIWARKVTTPFDAELSFTNEEKQEILRLKNDNNLDELFRLLFIKQCNALNEILPALFENVTQLFTPDWIVRYMVENSLGRLWVEGHPNDLLKSKWKYYLEEAEQESEVQLKLEEIHKEYGKLNPEDIYFIDPCMGSGHILVYAFDVLMQIYEIVGYSQRDAARSILENNIYGLDIDDRAYQMAYFAVMMKARQYNRRILSAEMACHVYSIQDSNNINRNQLTYFGVGLNEVEKNDALNQVEGLLDTFRDAKEYGSILNVPNYDWGLLRRFVKSSDVDGQMTLDAVGLDQTKERLNLLIDIGEVMAKKYEVVVTNPPYMGISNGNAKLNEYVKKNYPDSKSDLFSVFIERCGVMVKKNGYQAMITQHAWMFINSYEQLRNKINKKQFMNMIHLGIKAFEEIGNDVVQTCAFVLKKKYVYGYKTQFVRLVDCKNFKQKEQAYIEGKNRYIADCREFEKIPGSPLAYWVGGRFIDNFEGASYIENYGKLTGSQNITGDNEKAAQGVSGL